MSMGAAIGSGAQLSAAMAAGAEAVTPARVPLAIQTHGVSKHFGKRTVLRNVSLRVERGTTYGLIGLNGAGKSTLIRTLVGILPPSSGECSLSGVNVWLDHVGAMSRVGYVPDRPHVYPWMRVEGAIEFASQMWKDWDWELVERLLKQYRLDRTQRCGKLSKGQGAKLSLLLALAHSPSILILDEPTDGLDPVSRDEFLEQVLDATMDERQSEPSARRTVLISSHSLNDLERLSDTVGMLHNGELVLQEQTEVLLNDTRRYRVLLEGDEAPSGTAKRAIPGLLHERVRGREWTLTARGPSDAITESIRAAGKVGSVEVSPISLEDLFKDVVKGRLAHEEVTP